MAHPPMTQSQAAGEGGKRSPQHHLRWPASALFPSAVCAGRAGLGNAVGVPLRYAVVRRGGGGGRAVSLSPLGGPCGRHQGRGGGVGDTAAKARRTLTAVTRGSRHGGIQNPPRPPGHLSRLLPPPVLRRSPPLCGHHDQSRTLDPNGGSCGCARRWIKRSLLGVAQRPLLAPAHWLREPVRRP